MWNSLVGITLCHTRLSIMLSGKCGSLSDRALWGCFQAFLGEGWRDRWWIDTVIPSAFVRTKPVACSVLSCALDLVCSACIFVLCVFMYVFVCAMCVYMCMCIFILCSHVGLCVYVFVSVCFLCVCVQACSRAYTYSPWSCTNVSSSMEFPISSRKNQSRYHTFFYRTVHIVKIICLCVCSHNFGSPKHPDYVFFFLIGAPHPNTVLGINMPESMYTF